jgi:hypothetical protein
MPANDGSDYDDSLIEHVTGAPYHLIQLCEYQPELAALSYEELRLAFCIVVARVAPRDKIDDAICEGDSKKWDGGAHRSKCQA